MAEVLHAGNLRISMVSRFVAELPEFIKLIGP
jgi:hypothetical protein